MKKRLLFVSLFLISILFISGCLEDAFDCCASEDSSCSENDTCVMDCGNLIPSCVDNMCTCINQS